MPTRRKLRFVWNFDWKMSAARAREYRNKPTEQKSKVFSDKEVKHSNLSFLLIQKLYWKPSRTNGITQDLLENVGDTILKVYLYLIRLTQLSFEQTFVPQKNWVLVLGIWLGIIPKPKNCYTQTQNLNPKPKNFYTQTQKFFGYKRLYFGKTLINFDNPNFTIFYQKKFF